MKYPFYREAHPLKYTLPIPFHTIFFIILLPTIYAPRSQDMLCAPFQLLEPTICAMDSSVEQFQSTVQIRSFVIPLPGSDGF